MIAALPAVLVAVPHHHLIPDFSFPHKAPRRRHYGFQHMITSVLKASITMPIGWRRNTTLRHLTVFSLKALSGSNELHSTPLIALRLVPSIRISYHRRPDRIPQQPIALLLPKSRRRIYSLRHMIALPKEPCNCTPRRLIVQNGTSGE